MVRLRKVHEEPQRQEKVLEVDASMQGSLVFKDPVNLRINGNFEGTLNTKGKLYIGEKAQVKADIRGEDIVIAGHVTGDVYAAQRIHLSTPAQVVGNISTRALAIDEGALFDGTCKMISLSEQTGTGTPTISAEELAKYLEVDASMIFEWAKTGRIPATRKGDDWTFDRRKIEEWLDREKVH